MIFDKYLCHLARYINLWYTWYFDVFLFFFVCLFFFFFCFLFFLLFGTFDDAAKFIRYSNIHHLCVRKTVITLLKWVASWQNQQCGCAPSEDSDQPGHPPSLIRVFAVRMKKAWVLSYPLSAQRRLWSDWADAQADLSLRWVHPHFVGFVMRRLINKVVFYYQKSLFKVLSHRLKMDGVGRPRRSGKNTKLHRARISKPLSVTHFCDGGWRDHLEGDSHFIKVSSLLVRPWLSLLGPAFNNNTVYPHLSFSKQVVHSLVHFSGKFPETSI